MLWLSWSRDMFGFIPCCRVCLEEQSGKFPHLRSVFCLNPSLSYLCCGFQSWNVHPGAGFGVQGGSCNQRGVRLLLPYQELTWTCSRSAQGIKGWRIFPVSCGTSQGKAPKKVTLGVLRIRN